MVPVLGTKFIKEVHSVFFFLAETKDSDVSWYAAFKVSWFYFLSIEKGNIFHLWFGCSRSCYTDPAYVLCSTIIRDHAASLRSPAQEYLPRWLLIGQTSHWSPDTEQTSLSSCFTQTLRHVFGFQQTLPVTLFNYIFKSSVLLLPRWKWSFHT